MKTLSALTMVAALTLMAGNASGDISDPDHVIYGVPSLYGEPLFQGEVTLSIAGDASIIASYKVGSDPTMGDFYVLRVPMDSVGPRRLATARTGDSANIFIGSELAAELVIGERGAVQYLNVDPEDIAAVPALSIDDVAVAEGDAASVQVSFSVSLSVASEDPVTVDWITQDGTAMGEVSATCTGAADYLADSGMATIDPGDTNTTMPITVCGEEIEEIEEIDENFFVNLLNPSNAVLLDPQGKGTILDDDTPPQISINNVTVQEPENGTVHATFRISLSAVWENSVDFSYATADGTAEAGLDYLSTSGIGTIPAGSLETTVDVEILADIEDEQDETFTLMLSNPVNASILDSEGQGTIIDVTQFLVFVEAQQDGVAGVGGLNAAAAAVVSPDGAHIYVAAFNDDAVVVFQRKYR